MSADIDAIIAQIKYFHRDRCFAMESRKSLNLRLGAYLRQRAGWWMGMPEKERKAIEKAALKAISDPDSEDQMIVNTRFAIAPFEAVEDGALKQMEALAKLLPVWPFVESVRGFGAASFATIVAEAGDLSNYATEAKLWKRMGLAVMDGTRQGQIPKDLAGAARKDAWIGRGYSPMRRSRMWVIGETLIKAQIRVVKNADSNDTGERRALGPYGEAYLRRKVHTQITHPEWWRDANGELKVDKKTGRPTSDHGNFDAQRYAEKRLLRDLWRAWRRTTAAMAERPREQLSAAHSIAAE